MHDPDVIALHPDPKAANELQVCDKLPVPLIRMFGNFTNVAYNLDSAIGCQQQGMVCSGCDMLCKAHDVREVEGHKVALDPNFIQDPQIREWMSKGAKYRLNRDPKGVLVAVREGLGQYIELYAKAFKCKPEQVIKLENWKEKILQLTERNLICQSDKYNEEVRQDEQIK